MTEQQLSEIRSVSILQILGLKASGRKVFIRCPVHNEKSASMVIYPDGSYHCYGCSINGQNSIDFLMALGATFNEAVEELTKYK